MNKIFYFLIAVLLFFIFSCGSEMSIPQNTYFVKVDRGGCANGLPPGGNIETENKDTTYYFTRDGHLFIYVGFHATCCRLYQYDTKVLTDEIEIELKEVSNDPCDCICWYEFTFEFKNLEAKEYKYKIKVEDYLTFNGIVDLRN
jgi:hypothetical protein